MRTVVIIGVFDQFKLLEQSTKRYIYSYVEKKVVTVLR